MAYFLNHPVVWLEEGAVYFSFRIAIVIVVL